MRQKLLKLKKRKLYNLLLHFTPNLRTNFQKKHKPHLSLNNSPPKETARLNTSMCQNNLSSCISNYIKCKHSHRERSVFGSVYTMSILMSILMTSFLKNV